jgi:YD repeat-containing protein
MGDPMMQDNGNGESDSPEGRSKAASESVAAPCPDCRGSGQVVLLASSRACRRCGGAGRVDRAGGNTGRTLKSRDGSTCTYDEQGRITVRTWPGTVEVSTWRLTDEELYPAGTEARGVPEPQGDTGAGVPAVCAECYGMGNVTFPGGSRRCSCFRRARMVKSGNPTRI